MKLWIFLKIVWGFEIGGFHMSLKTAWMVAGILNTDNLEV